MSIIHSLKLTLKKSLPNSIYGMLWLLPRYREYPAILAFIVRPTLHASFRQRIAILFRIVKISVNIQCLHTTDEVLRYVRTILTLPKEMKGVVVEAGCFQGGSTAKFSLAADLADRELVVFDSFQGIPHHEEEHGVSIFGETAVFPEGVYTATLDQVKKNVALYGKVDRCRFIRGWFEDTMPNFHERVAAAYLDVDLATSTKTCLKYLYPLMVNGGTLYSQDGHLPLVLDVFCDETFWRTEVGDKAPTVHGFGASKLIMLVKSA